MSLRTSLYLIIILYIFEVTEQNENNSRAPDLCFFVEDKCPTAGITFLLFHSSLQKNGLKLDLSNVTERNFVPKLPLKILIHGFNGSMTTEPNIDVLPMLLKYDRDYVVSVDYSPLVRIPCYYPWAISNGNIVAKCVAQLIDNLIDADAFKREEIHIIGFSLGAQIAGLVANHAKHRLKRITGLDPARPAFTTVSLTEKLDSSDADFVDVIHTDPLLYSMLLPAGDADFYPNFGKWAQAGCSYYQDGRLINCNHFRASLYYAESITSDIGFWAYNCGSWWEYLFRRCHNYGHMPLVNMGYHVSENASGSYFLSTNTEAPFALGIPVGFQLDVFEESPKPIE